MSSRFVSAGAINAATGEEATPQPPANTTTTTKPTEKQAAWAAATAQLEADRLRRREQQERAQSSQEKSLYEVLQANKAAKQAAFEEAHRLRNQFRALDDDEVDFLDEVRARKRREEDAARREVERGLQAFREAQRRGPRGGKGEGGDGGGGGGGGGDDAGGGDADADAEGLLGEFGFGVDGRKRRRGDVGRERKRVKGLGVIVKRASTGGAEGGREGKVDGKEQAGAGKGESEGGVLRESSSGGNGEASTAVGPRTAAPMVALASPPAPAAPASTSTAKPGGLLVDYGSDDDDD